MLPLLEEISRPLAPLEGVRGDLISTVACVVARWIRQRVQRLRQSRLKVSGRADDAPPNVDWGQMAPDVLRC